MSFLRRLRLGGLMVVAMDIALVSGCSSARIPVVVDTGTQSAGRLNATQAVIVYPATMLDLSMWVDWKSDQSDAVCEEIHGAIAEALVERGLVLIDQEECQAPLASDLQECESLMREQQLYFKPLARAKVLREHLGSLEAGQLVVFSAILVGAHPKRAGDERHRLAILVFRGDTGDCIWARESSFRSRPFDAGIMDGLNDFAANESAMGSLKAGLTAMLEELPER